MPDDFVSTDSLDASHCDPRETALTIHNRKRNASTLTDEISLVQPIRFSFDLKSVREPRSGGWLECTAWRDNSGVTSH